jgi:hypothetical protein
VDGRSAKGPFAESQTVALGKGTTLPRARQKHSAKDYFAEHLVSALGKVIMFFSFIRCK